MSVVEVPTRPQEAGPLPLRGLVGTVTRALAPCQPPCLNLILEDAQYQKHVQENTLFMLLLSHHGCCENCNTVIRLCWTHSLYDMSVAKQQSAG